MKQVFIDGSAGTTGLRIVERLESRNDLSLIRLPEAMRKDPAARKEAINKADLVFLCLPDDAARESVALLENPNTVLLDTSTAHRTQPGWLYGFPEINPQIAKAMPAAQKIAVPGCHASGFIALIAPLLSGGILSPDVLLTCTSVTGYSGGGKSMIAQYQSPEGSPLLLAPRQYGLSQTHKHLKEMQAITGLHYPPAFSPIVSNFYSGMCVTIPLFSAQLAPGKTIHHIKEAYAASYTGPMVSFVDQADEAGFLSAAALSGSDRMELSVFGNDDRILLAARYDNLGKGASGAAIECMNLCLGLDPTTGLTLSSEKEN